MKNKERKTTKEEFDEIVKYLEMRGIEVTIDDNPSPERVAEIKAIIAKNEALQEAARIRFKNK